MSGILNSIYIIVLLVKRNLLFWLLIVLYFAYLYLGIRDFSNPAETAMAMSFLVQGGILAFLLIGVLFIRMDERHEIDQLFLSIRNAFLFKFIGKLIGGFLLVFVLCLLSIIFIMGASLLKGQTLNHISISLFEYILLYWGCTFLISLLLGMLFAMWIKGKLIYPVMLIIWALIGPINTTFIGSTSYSLHLPFLPQWLNLGEPNIAAPFNALYGFALSPYHWLKHFIWLIIIASLLLIYIQKKQQFSYRKLSIGLFVLILLFIPTAYGLSLDWQLYISDTSSKSREVVDQMYYHQHSQNGKENHVTISQYNIDLSIDRLLTAKVRATVRNSGSVPIKGVHLSMYRQLKVQSITANNRNLSFEQKGDFISISLNQTLQPNDAIMLSFFYRGKSSPNFFANTQAVYLPYYFNWLPSTVLKPSFKMDHGQLIRVNHQLDHLTHFHLIYNGRQPLYTNIKQKDDNVWDGTSTRGLSLVSGELQSRTVLGSRLIYPNTWQADNYLTFHAQLNQMINTVSKSFTFKKMEYPKEIMFFPILSASDSLNEAFMWYSPDHLIFGTPLGDIKSWLLGDNRFLTYWMVPALTWKYKKIDVADFDYLQAFDLTYGYVYNHRQHIDDNGDFLNAMSRFQGNSQNKAEVVDLLTSWLKQSGHFDKKNQFCIEWFHMMEKGKTTWGDLLDLLHHYTQGAKR